MTTKTKVWLQNHTKIPDLIFSFTVDKILTRKGHLKLCPNVHNKRKKIMHGDAWCMVINHLLGVV